MNTLLPPVAAKLAAQYVAQVRRNGPAAIANVAGAGPLHGSHYPRIDFRDEHARNAHFWEIACEVQECDQWKLCPMPDDDSIEAADRVQDLLHEAAEQAINEFRRDLDLPTI